MAFSTGERLAREDVLFVDGEPAARRQICVLSWCLRGPTTIVVDSGLRYSPLPGNEEKFDQDGASLVERLATIGVEADDVEFLLLTHLHHDHCENVAAFPNATVVTSARGWQWLDHAESFEERAFPRALLREHFSSNEGALRLVENGEEVVPGITTVQTAGHTPCSQMYLVQTRDGIMAFTGDELMLGESWRLRRRVGLSMNPLGSEAALSVACDLCSGIFPSHDPAALTVDTTLRF